MEDTKTMKSRIDKISNSDQGFVADGYDRAIAGVEVEIRPMVEQKYADEWNASGLIKRWLLLRRIEREIGELVAERAKHISPDSLF
jgi:hypothetical protein